MDISKNFVTNEKAEVEGREISLGEGAKVQLARWQNKKFSRMIKKQHEAHDAVLKQEGDEAEARGEQILVDVMANTVLLGWSGIEWEGKKLEYSTANAAKLLAVKDFRKVIIEHCSNFNNYLASREEEFAKNSAKPSAGA